MHRPDYDQLIADPLFKAGYREIFDGVDGAVDVRSSEEETLAYVRGRDFGSFVRTYEGCHVPLSRGALAHPRAKHLLVLAMAGGEVA